MFVTGGTGTGSTNVAHSKIDRLNSSPPLQILSAICGEKFVTSPVTQNYSSDGRDSENEAGLRTVLLPWKGHEEETPLIYHSTTGLVFQIRLETAAKKVVDDFSKSFESIVDEGGSSDDVDSLGNELGIETIPLNGNVEKPEIFQSRGSVFQVSFQPAAKKVNGKPLVDQGNQLRTEVCHLEDVAINRKWKKKIAEDSNKKTALLLQKGDREKATVFQVHIDPAAKEGNGKPLVDQNNEQRKEVGGSKDATLTWKKMKLKKKEIVEEGRENEPIIKCDKEERDSSNVTKKKEFVENRCNHEAIIKSLNVKKKEIVEDFHNYDSSGSNSSSDSTIKDENGKPITNQSKNFHKNKTINKSSSLVWRKKNIVIDESKTEPIINAYILTKKKIDEMEEKPLIIKGRGSVFQVCVAAKSGIDNHLADQRNNQSKEMDHHKNDTINKTLIVKEEEKPAIFKEPAAKKVDHNKQIMEFGTFNKAITKIDLGKKKIDENIEKPLISKARGSVFQVCVAAKSGIDNHLADQRNNQRKEMDHHEDDTINKALIVKEEEKPAIFKEPSAKKVDHIKPLADFSNKQIKEFKTINKAITKIDLGKKKIDENEENPLIIKARGSVFQVCVAANSGIDNHLADQRNNQWKAMDHHKEDTINKTLIVKEEEKPVIFKEPAANKVDDNKPLADFSNKQIKEIDTFTDLGDNDIVWLKHYNNKQKILMVGEGDFSFSASLAVAFGSSASKITATSFDNRDYLRCNYKNSTGNIEELTNRGATVRHGVDATKMSNYWYWKDIKFDRIIYNFPYSGCPKTESRETQMRQHLELVRGFLLNAKEMLGEGGEIHISHKTNSFHSDWKLKELAGLEGLWLVGETKFNRSDYPGYETKQGYNGDLNFDCIPSSTYMFASIPK